MLVTRLLSFSKQSTKEHEITTEEDKFATVSSAIRAYINHRLVEKDEVAKDELDIATDAIYEPVIDLLIELT